MVYSLCKGKIRRSHCVQMGKKLLKSYGEILQRQLLSKNIDKRRLFYSTDFLTQGTIGPIWLRPTTLAEVFTMLTYAKREKFAFFKQNDTTLIETKISESPEFSFEIYSLLCLVFSFNVFQDLILQVCFSSLRLFTFSATNLISTGCFSRQGIISP